MAVLLDANFDTDRDGFDAGTQIASEGSDWATGYLDIASGVTATATHTGITTSIARIDFWFSADDSESISGTTKDHIFYWLPSAAAVSSANAAFFANISRDTAVGATNGQCVLRTRNSGGFVTIAPNLPKGAFYWKISAVVNVSARTFDLYINDILWLAAQACPNTTFTDIGKVVLLANAAAPTTHFDNIKVESSYAFPTESTVIDHDFTTGATGEIEALTPTTDTRNIQPQPWWVPDDQTTYGGFTVANTTGGSPDASKVNVALIRCCAEGVAEAEFQSASSGTIYFGLMVRSWGGYDLTSNSFYLFRVLGGATNTIVLFQGGTSLASASFTPVANTTYTLKIEMRGRYLFCSRKAAAMGSGSYTTVFTHLLDTDAHGARGLLSEEHCGPFIQTTAGLGSTNNKARRFRFTYRNPDASADVSIGDYRWGLNPGSVRELYALNSTLPARNLFLSKGIQNGHQSGHDMGNYVCQQRTLFSATNIKSYQQRGQNISEDEIDGYSDCYITFTRRGAWVFDQILALTVNQGLAPDHDFRPALWDRNYKVVGPSGSVSDLSDSSYATWRDDISNITLPAAFQRVSETGAGSEVRFTAAFAHSNYGSNVVDILHKLEGTGDPMSHAISLPAANQSAGTQYKAARAYLLETGALSLSSTILTGWRDDVNAPASLSSFVNGSLKTDASGDADTDGFNERYGWFEVTATGTLSFTVSVGGATRYYPQVRVNSWATTSGSVTINGTPAVNGTDYTVDDLGDGTALLQLLSTYATDTTIAFSTKRYLLVRT